MAGNGAQEPAATELPGFVEDESERVYVWLGTALDGRYGYRIYATSEKMEKLVPLPSYLPS